ncbi:MAG: hypothetical protein GY842_10165 [bacterium]|nr:hypothetical protein [bacterium]
MPSDPRASLTLVTWRPAAYSASECRLPQQRTAQSLLPFATGPATAPLEIAANDAPHRRRGDIAGTCAESFGCYQCQARLSMWTEGREM